MTPIAAASKIERKTPFAPGERLLRCLAVADINHHTQPVRRAADRILDHRGLLADPDRAAIASDHPILGKQRVEIRPRLGVCLGHPLGVAGMDDVQPQLVVGQPRVTGIPQHRFDLRADIDRMRVARIVQLHPVQIGDHTGSALDQGLEAPLGLRSHRIGSRI
jgi:hypothetical protein